MTAPADHVLDALPRRYAAVLAGMASTVGAFQAAPSLETLRERYAAGRFVRLPRIAPGGPLSQIAVALADLLGPLAVPVVTPHRPTPDGRLGYGGRFRRIDPAQIEDPRLRHELERVFDEVGLTAFGAGLGEVLAPLLRAVVGPLRYRRVYLYLYGQDDYLAAHDDAHVGARVDVQFPVTIGGAGGIRILEDGLFRTHHDAAGTANILGPAMWHDAPSPMPADRASRPLRINLGLRFTPDDAGPRDARGARAG